MLISLMGDIGHVRDSIRLFLSDPAGGALL